MTDTVNVPTFRLAEATRPTRTTRASRPTATHAPVAADGESAPTWMRALGAVLLLGGGALTAAVLGWPGDAPEVALLVPGVVALVGGALLLLARTRIAVTDTDVVLRFRPSPHAGSTVGGSPRSRSSRRTRPPTAGSACASDGASVPSS